MLNLNRMTKNSWMSLQYFIHLLLDTTALELEGAEKLGFCSLKKILLYVLCNSLIFAINLLEHLKSYVIWHVYEFELCQM